METGKENGKREAKWRNRCNQNGVILKNMQSGRKDVMGELKGIMKKEM